MPPEGIEIVHCWPVSESSGSDSIQFIEVVVAVESEVCLLDVKVRRFYKHMWCNLPCQNLLQGKEKHLLKYILCLRRSCLRPPTLYSK